MFEIVGFLCRNARKIKFALVSLALVADLSRNIVMVFNPKAAAEIASGEFFDLNPHRLREMTRSAVQPFVGHVTPQQRGM